MIFQDILTAEARRNYDRLKSALKKYGVQTRVYESMDTEDLEKVIVRLNRKKEGILANLPFEREHQDPQYGIAILEVAAVKSLLSEKIEVENERALIPGVTYYRKVKRSGNMISGERCTYLGESRPANWTKFVDDVRVLKAMQLMEHGSDADFSRIYFVLADGKPKTAASRPSLEHLLESSNSAKNDIARYCDARWEGDWPWDAPASGKLKKIIERKNMDRNRRIAEVRSAINSMMRAVFEGEVEKSEVIISGREMADKITSMIHELSKLSASLMAEFKDQVRTEFGQDSVQGLTDISTTKISAAVDSLGDIKAAIDEYLKNLQEGGTAGSDNLAGGGDGIDLGHDDLDGGKDKDGKGKSSKGGLDLPDMGDGDGVDMDLDGSGKGMDLDLDMGDLEGGGDERKKKGK